MSKLVGPRNNARRWRIQAKPETHINEYESDSDEVSVTLSSTMIDAGSFPLAEQRQKSSNACTRRDAGEMLSVALRVDWGAKVYKMNVSKSGHCYSKWKEAFEAPVSWPSFGSIGTWWVLMVCVYLFILFIYMCTRLIGAFEEFPKWASI